METILFPRVQRLAREYLLTQLAARGKAQFVGTKNPRELPSEWIRLRSQGGPRSFTEWRVMLDTYIYTTDEVVAEENSNLVQSLLLDVPGVGIVVPEYPGPYPWVRMARYVSGPTSLDPDEDLPNLEVYRIVTTWHVLPIPKEI
jgi:hypothetical protein